MTIGWIVGGKLDLRRLDLGLNSISWQRLTSAYLSRRLASPCCSYSRARRNLNEQRAQEIFSDYHGPPDQWEDCYLSGAAQSKKKTVKAFLEQIPARLQPTITHFTTDMWEGSLKAITEFIAEHDDVSASPVIDRFQVTQHYRDDFDRLRKQELRRLKKELPQAIYDRDCKGRLWTLRKNHTALNPDEYLALCP